MELFNTAMHADGNFFKNNPSKIYYIRNPIKNEIFEITADHNPLNPCKQVAVFKIRDGIYYRLPLLGPPEWPIKPKHLFNIGKKSLMTPEEVIAYVIGKFKNGKYTVNYE